MECRKCKKSIPDDAVFCCYCGIKQEKKPYVRRRSNGEGTVYQRGTTFSAEHNYYSNGDRIRVYKGGFRTKKEAYEWLKKPIETTKKEADAQITFIGLYNRFIERHADRVTKSTLNCYKAAYKYFEPLYLMKFTDITTEDWQDCIDDCPNGKRTKQNMKALGTLLYKFANEQQITTQDYAQYIWIPKDNEQESYNPFSKDHLQMLWNAAKNGDRDAQIIIVDCYTGYRPTALLEMKCEDYVDGCLVGGIKTDAGKDRKVPVPSSVIPFVEQFAAEKKQTLFTLNGKSMSINYYRENSFYPCLARLGIQNMPSKDARPTYTPYSCRHTYATMLKSVSGSEKDKAAMMGHTSYEMTLHYTHERIEDMRSIAEQLC